MKRKCVGEGVLRILNLEDDPVDSKLVFELLNAEGLTAEIDRVDTLAGYREALEYGSFSLILSDYTLHGMDSSEALHLALRMRPDLPFIFLSGTEGEELAIEALKMGATDYVLKQRIARLVPAVRRALKEAEEQSRLKREHEELRRAYDELKERLDVRNCREEAVRRSEDLLRSVIDSMPVGVWLSDERGNITSINQMAEYIWKGRRYIGIEQFDEFKGWWADSGKRIEAHEWALARAIEKGETTLNEEIEIECFNGKRRHILNSAVCLRGKDGRIIGGIAINQDITDLKRMEEELRKAKDELEERVRERTKELRLSEEKYRELVENANSIILRVNSKGNITFFNEFAERFFGYKEEEVLGRHIIGTIVPEKESSGRDLVVLMDGTLRNPERYGSSENENIKRGGERVWISWTNRALYDENGVFEGLLSIGNDITERRRSEVALGRANRALRTLGKCNEALVRARR